MRWAEHVVQMTDVRKTYKNWDEENRWEEPLRIINLKKYIYICDEWVRNVRPQSRRFDCVFQDILLGCYAVYSGKYLPAFRRSIMPYIYDQVFPNA
jgi:hypothetical protein